MTFAGKSILVTGASSGLGAASVRRFAAGGGLVYAASRDQEKLAEVAASCADLPGEVRFGPLDVASPADCRAAVAAAVDAYGRLDVLVNNAGRHDFRITTDVTEDEWDADIALNLSGAFYLCQAAIPHLLETSGNIVNVASVAGVMGEAYSAAYTAAKHGIVGLTKALAIEYLNDADPGELRLPRRHGHSAGGDHQRPRRRRLGADHAGRREARNDDRRQRRRRHRLPGIRRCVRGPRQHPDGRPRPPGRLSLPRVGRP